MRSVWGSRRRAATVVATAVTVLLSTGALEVRAQLLPGVGGQQTPPTTASPAPTSSSSTTTSSTTTTTTAPSTTTQPGQQLLVPPGSGDPSTTTTAPPSTSTSEPLPPAGGDGAPAPGIGPMPEELQRQMNSVRRTPANNTKKLVAALAPLQDFGLDPTQQAIVGFGRFPVAGVATWSDDWWFPRFGPGWRLHQGLDIFAPYGTPVRAPVDGTVRLKTGGLGGITVYVTQPDRTFWYLAHLAGTAPGLVDGAAVRTGQVVGYVGDSGNARGSSPHVHLEIHPRGGGPIPPKPVVDKFVADALALAPQLVQSYANAAQQGGQQAPPVFVPLPEPELETLTPREALLWASAANPAGGTLRLVEADARDAASRIDWDRIEARAAARKRAQRRAWLAVRPLVPDALAKALDG